MKKNVFIIPLITSIIWTSISLLTYLLDDKSLNQAVLDIALNAAKSSYQTDLLYRQWATIHGGVYAPITEKYPPNPNLSFIEERDIETPSGRKLTLINPAYMTRQVQELGAELYEFKGHITSLNPIRAENSPDPWEEEALKQFQQGKEEVYSIETISNEPYLRYMKPMITESSCLKCHAHQGYFEGDIRGGISVSIPFSKYSGLTQSYKKANARDHITIYLFGIIIIFIFSVILQKKNIALWNSHRMLRTSEEKFKLAIQASKDGVFDWNIATHQIYLSPRWKEILGFKDSEIESSLYLWIKQTFPSDVKRILQELRACLSGNKDECMIEYRMINKSGQLINVLSKALVMRNRAGKAVRLIGMQTDMTEILQREKMLTKAMKEKVVLIRELYHRTKNNMQVISGLLKLQSLHSENKNVKSNLLDAERRIMSMALVHKKLYESENLLYINLSSYITDLCNSITEIHQDESIDKTFNLSLDNIDADIEKAVPIGLVLNELLTNSLKYGGNRDSIIITIKMSYNPKRLIEILYKDNGPGLGENFKIEEQDSLGMKLIRNIVQNQLNGTISFSNPEEGLECLILFE